MTIKAIFFDAAGTLMKPNRSVGESYAAFAAAYGVNLAPAELSRRFRVCFGNAPRLAFPGASAEALVNLERGWWKRLVAEIFEPCGPFEKFDDLFDELFAYYASPGAWSLYPEVLETLAALQSLELRSSVISNFDSRLVRILDGLGVGDFFDQIFVSTRVGYAKPDPQIFQAALRHHGLAPEESLHIGDSEINDLRGANNAGLRAILIDRDGPADSVNDGQRVTSLRSILDIVR
ncbi:MAG TPA: HAD-IA family hydrolase [Candidatus Binatia bacterium]|nr:HAD-IA family hydrolase [Candidatus Binatia bacterium]